MGKRGGLRKGNAADPLINIEPGDNSKYLLNALEVRAIGQTKVDLTNYDAVLDRINKYFGLMTERDQKPTMTGLAMALGYDRRRIHEIINNQPIGGLDGYQAKFYGHTTNPTPDDVKDLIKQSVNVMTLLWEDYMQNGKINPASGIFIGKNFYGMRDEVEHVITPNTNPVDEYSADDIAARYIEDKKKK